jgi:hypothetical protein
MWLNYGVVVVDVAGRGSVARMERIMASARAEEITSS